MSLFLLKNLYPQFLFNDDDQGGGGSGGDGDDKGGDDKGADDKDQGGDDKKGLIDKDKVMKKDDDAAGDDDKKADDDKAKDDKPAERPEWLDEKFWDAEKNEPRLEQMQKSYKELEKKLGSSTGKPPKSPDDYEIKFDDKTKEALFGKNDPKKDPIVAAVTKRMHEKGFSQEALDEVFSSFGEAAVKYLEENKVPDIDVKAETEKLGKNADAIIENQVEFLGGLYKRGELNETQMQELLILTETAAGVQALQALRAHYGDSQKIPLNLDPDKGIKSAEELRAMQADKKYGVDKEYTAMVDAEYEKKYGTGRSGESQRSAL